MTTNPSPFDRTRALFKIPEDITYLDGNSLGPLTISAKQRLLRACVDEWGAMLINGWNEAGWIDLAAKIGDRIGKLIGAPTGSVAVGDSTSVNLFKVLAAALDLNPGRRKIVSEESNFPTDLYIAKGLARSRNQGHELITVHFDRIADAIDHDTAAVMVTEVDYRSGRRHDMAALTKMAHQAGAPIIFDLAHSAGALPVDLDACDVDFAVGCGYKYLNGGPGAPAFAYAATRHHNRIKPALAGWLGHRAPFDFDRSYTPAEGIARLTVGTPPILSLSALDAALDAFDGVDMAMVRARSVELSELLLDRLERHCPELKLISPRDSELRGSHLSFSFRHGYAAIRALIARGVIGDFRSPDVMRFGITPLYLSEDDIIHAAGQIADVVNNRGWDAPAFKTRAKVT